MLPIHIRVLRHSAFYTPLLLTIKAGFLAEEGLEASYDIADKSNTVEKGLNSGQVHVAQSAVATAFAGLDRGETTSVRHFAQINQRDGFFLTARQPVAKFQWRDLVGATVLVDHFFQPLAMFRYALFKQSVDFAELNVVDAGDVDGIDRYYREGYGDYVHQQGPYAQQLEADGFGHVAVAVGDAVGPVAFSSLCATQDWLQTDMAAAFFRAYVRGREAAMTFDAEQIAALEAEFFPSIDESVLCKTIGAYQKLGCWGGGAKITEEIYDKTLDVFAYNGMISVRYAYDDIICTPPAV